MRFRDRADAGRLLADRLRHLSGIDPVVLALPRGGIPVATEIARALHARMDVLVVRKLGVPYQPELAMGAVGEDGVVVWNDDVRRLARVADAEAEAVVQRETAELQRRARLLRGGGRPLDVTGRTVVVVDDGAATGSTAVAGCRVLRARRAARIVVAVPVAPPSTIGKLAAEADDVVTVLAPPAFASVGEWYDDFAQLTDDQIVRLIGGPPAAAHTPSTVGIDVEVDAGGVRLAGELAVPIAARGVVVFAHGTGSNRSSPRNRAVANALAEQGFATLLFDLQTAAEQSASAAEPLPVDIAGLGGRVAGAVTWIQDQRATAGLPVGLFGASTGAAAALWAAAEPTSPVAALVCRGGRLDLARPRLPSVAAPTLLMVGGRDGYVEEVNRRTLPLLHCTAELKVVAGAGHLFDQPGALAAVSELASEWFRQHLSRAQAPQHPSGKHVT